MSALERADKPATMSRCDYLLALNEVARYALTRGAPFFLSAHLNFLIDYYREWCRKDGEDAVSEALTGRARGWSKGLAGRLGRAQRLPKGVRPLIPLAPLLIPLLVILPGQLVLSVCASALHVLKKGARSVPPLITAVVVVFVTSDAWRFLGTGFTLRFYILVGAFLAGSQFFLIRLDYWGDIDAPRAEEAQLLLERIRKRHPDRFKEFTDRDIVYVPMSKLDGPGQAWIYVVYIALSLFSLLVAAAFVAAALIVVGFILINGHETQDLAHSVYIYWKPSGDFVFTQQLLSLSLSLGAFAAFFLVAAQRDSDRKEFMAEVLSRLRRAMLAYTIYCCAHDRAEEWTGVHVSLKQLDRRNQPQGEQQPDRQQDDMSEPAVTPVT
jgi:hypothetical protein